ncbi:MAG: EAL domain-containing protein [Alphaproteobacteria bacterium]|nr:EAL domain-containing protein [Alphaproteobacteria bacterium]
MNQIARALLGGEICPPAPWPASWTLLGADDTPPATPPWLAPPGQPLDLVLPDRRLRVIARASAQPEGVVLTLLDLEEQRAIAARLQESEDRYRSLTELISDYAYELTVDNQGRLVPYWVTDAFQRVTGFHIEEMLAQGGLKSIVLAADHGVLRRHIRAVMGGHAHACELRIKTRGGAVRWIRDYARPIFDEQGGRVVGVLGASRDITEEKLLNPLTGLPNLAAFQDRLGVAIERLARDPRSSLSVLYVDFDHFHVFNHSLGWAAGDTLLRTLGQRLREAVRPGDTVAHLRGDEFAVLLTELPNPTDAIRMTEALLSAISAPVELAGTEVTPSASVGVAFARGHHEQVSDLLQAAQTALSRARSRGGGRYEVYDPAMFRASLARLRKESALRAALSRGDFPVFYQPIVSLSDGALSGFEALVRWRDPERGLVGPQQFVPLAERTGLIVDIGGAVLLAACQQLAAWSAEVPAARSLAVSVNVSPQQLHEDSLIEHIDAALAASGVAPERLQLEITETALVEGPEANVDRVARLKERGVRVGLDDFGTGYSSLSWLQVFPVDTLKVDRSFIRELDGPSGDAGIVGTIVALARHLGLVVVAEGIETADQRRVVEALGCEFAQGFLFARPLPAEAATALVRRWPRW